MPDSVPPGPGILTRVVLWLALASFGVAVGTLALVRVLRPDPEGQDPPREAS